MKRRTGLLKLTCLISLGVAAVGAVNVEALSYQSNVGVGFTFEPTLNVTLSGTDLTINNLTPGLSAEDSNIITVGVSTNVAYGYNLLATVGNAANTTTGLVNGSNSFAALSSNVENLAGFTSNTWGYSYCITNCNAATNWVSGSQGSTSEGYAGLPLYTGAGVQLASADDKTSSSAQFKIAAKAGATQASGEYTNVVNFAAVSKVGVVTLLDAFVASGAIQQNGYYTMQSMTPGICSAASKGSSIQLIDKRDGKMYWVAKLNDNKCWMTQNLELDLDSTAVAGSANALTSENTNLKTYGSNGYDSNNGYSCSNASTTSNCTDTDEVITWVPVRTTVTSIDSSNFPNTTAANSTSYSYNPGDQYYYPSTSGNDFRYTLAECESHGYTDCAHYKAGNYYNWSASVASNNTSSYTTNNTDAGNSVCPKGWRLPKKTASEYQSLVDAYGITASNALDLRNPPLYFVRSGRVDGGSLINASSYGFYWPSTVRDGSYVYYLYFGGGYLIPAGINFRYYGFPVRCVAE